MTSMNLFRTLELSRYTINEYKVANFDSYLFVWLTTTTRTITATVTAAATTTDKPICVWVDLIPSFIQY